jgi:hypothetical protein
MRRRNLLQLLPAAFLTSAFANQSASITKPATASLAGDVDIIEESLRTLHPGLLRYNTLAQIDTGFTSLRKAFIEAPDLAQRYLALQRFLSSLRCGHSYCNFFNQSKAVATELFDRKSRLPFTFRWIDDAMVITGNHLSPDAVSKALPLGAIVESINGVSSKAVLETLMNYTRVDGNNAAKQRNLLSVRGLFRLEYFDVMYGLVYGAPANGLFALRVRLPDKERGYQSAVELAVPALTATERHAKLPNVPKDSPVWDWQQRPDGIAVLTMPGWAVYNTKWDWAGWLNERLDRMADDRTIKGLIVDVRGNEGGLDCGNVIIERFAKRDSVLTMRRLVRFQQSPQKLRPVLDTWDQSFHTLGKDQPKFDDRFFQLPSGSVDIKPKGKAIDRPLVVLVDAANSSATYAFAQRIKSDRIGTLVGETTGGNQRGINGGSFFFVRLPASGIEFDLPLVGVFPTKPIDDVPDAGIEPEIEVKFTGADIASGRDPQLDRAVARVLGS